MINKPTLHALNAAGAPMPLARELGERLGGEPYVKPIPKLEPIACRVQRLNPDLWPPEAAAEIRAIYAGEIQ